VAHDAGALDRLARVRRRIEFVVGKERLVVRQAAAHLLVRAVGSRFQSEIRRRAAAGSDGDFLHVAIREAVFRHADFVIPGEEIHGLVAPAFSEHHVDDVLVYVLEIHLGGFEFGGSFDRAGSRAESGQHSRGAAAGALHAFVLRADSAARCQQNWKREHASEARNPASVVHGDLQRLRPESDLQS